MDHQHEHAAEHHIASTKMYVTVFLALMVCTVLTYQVWKINLGFYNFIVAIAIAIFKATLVITYFMHVKWSHTLSKMALATAVVFLTILLCLLSMDYASRGWQPRNTGWEKYPVLKN